MGSLQSRMATDFTWDVSLFQKLLYALFIPLYAQDDWFIFRLKLGLWIDKQ